MHGRFAMNIVQLIIRYSCYSLSVTFVCKFSMVKVEDKVCNTSMFEHGMYQVLHNFFYEVRSKQGMSLTCNVHVTIYMIEVW